MPLVSTNTVRENHLFGSNTSDDKSSAIQSDLQEFALRLAGISLLICPLSRFHCLVLRPKYFYPFPLLEIVIFTVIKHILSRRLFSSFPTCA